MSHQRVMPARAPLLPTGEAVSIAPAEDDAWALLEALHDIDACDADHLLAEMLALLAGGLRLTAAAGGLLHGEPARLFLRTWPEPSSPSFTRESLPIVQAMTAGEAISTPPAVDGTARFVAPLRAEGAPFGAFLCCRTTPFSPAEQRLLALAARQVGWRLALLHGHAPGTRSKAPSESPAMVDRPSARAAPLARELAEALSRATEAGELHTPSLVFFDAEGHPLLTICPDDLPVEQVPRWNDILQRLAVTRWNAQWPARIVSGGSGQRLAAVAIPLPLEIEGLSGYLLAACTGSAAPSPEALRAAQRAATQAAEALRSEVDAADLPADAPLGQALLSLGDPQGLAQVMRLALQTIVDDVPGALGAALHLAEDKRLLLQAAEGLLPPESDARHFAARWRRVIRRAIRTGAPEYLRPTQGGHQASQDERALMVLPLLTFTDTGDGDGPLGALSIYGPREALGRVARGKRLAPLVAMAARTAHNLRHVQRLEREKAALEQSREAIWRSKDALETILHSFPHGLLIVDRAQRVILQNRALAADGVAEGIIGRPCHEVMAHHRGLCAGCRIAETLHSGRITQRTVRIEEARTGRHLEWEIATHPIVDQESGGVQAAIVIVRDVTEQRHLAAALVETEKLAAVGRLAAGVAHEINNPLAAITANAQILLQIISAPEGTRESLEIISRSAERAQRVVRDLLTVAGDAGCAFEPTEVNETIISALELATHRLRGAEIAIEQRLADDLPLIIASHEHLVTLWLNLTLAGVERLRETGMPGRIVCWSRRENRDKVRITLEMSGASLRPLETEGIFAPLHRAPTARSETGLGLSSCYQVVRQHGGTIRAKEGAAGQTLFEVVLPVNGKTGGLRPR